MAEEFDYGALWSIARDAHDAVNSLTNAICHMPRSPIAPWAYHNNPPPDAHKKWEAALKALPERREKAINAIRKAGENLAKLLAEDQFVAPVTGVWPPRAPEIAHRLSSGLGMAAIAARTIMAWKDDAHIDHPKRYAVDAKSILCGVVAELEHRPDVAEMAYQHRVEKLQAEHPVCSVADELARWQDNEGSHKSARTAAQAVGKRIEKKPKRSTEKGEGRAKLIAALTKHHKYADGGCLNLTPIGNNELARMAGVDQATASAFFKKQFKGHAKYKTACKDSGRLVTALKLLNGEFAPHLLYGAKPPDEDDRDEE